VAGLLVLLVVLAGCGGDGDPAGLQGATLAHAERRGQEQVAAVLRQAGARR
jgi:hypothetical protein